MTCLFHLQMSFLPSASVATDSFTNLQLPISLNTSMPSYLLPANSATPPFVPVSPLGYIASLKAAFSASSQQQGPRSGGYTDAMEVGGGVVGWWPLMVVAIDGGAGWGGGHWCCSGDEG